MDKGNGTSGLGLLHTLPRIPPQVGMVPYASGQGPCHKWAWTPNTSGPEPLHKWAWTPAEVCKNPGISAQGTWDNWVKNNAQVGKDPLSSMGMAL